MAFLKPDNIITVKVGNDSLTIKQKIIPDSMTAPKKVCSYVPKGAKMKPCAKLNNGTGKPKGITVHNTDDISVAKGTTAAEQYCRATYNGNMNGVVVHFYVWEDDIWQLLNENERGWHAADGSSRRSSRRPGQTIGGNLDTIAIECVGNRKGSEATAAKLAAYLCVKHGLDPKYDVYTHQYFYSAKYCPCYILPHWTQFADEVKTYYNRAKYGAPANADKPSANGTSAKDFLHKRGYFRYGDTDVNIGRISAWMRRMYPSYTSVAALGNYFGPNLKRAVTEFQRRTGLEPDGNIGPLTLAEMTRHGFKLTER